MTSDQEYCSLATPATKRPPRHPTLFRDGITSCGELFPKRGEQRN